MVEELEEEIQVPEEYDLEDLLTEPEKVTVLVERRGKPPVEQHYWIRPPDELEKTMAQNAARKVARELRELLQTEGSEERELLVNTALEEMTEEEMRLLWVASNLVHQSYEMERRSLNDREDFFVPRPEGKDDGVIPPTVDELDQYEIDKRKAEKDRLASLNKQQKSLFTRLSKEADELDVNDLKNIVEPMIIEQKTAEESNNQYGMYILVKCTYKDPELTEKAFKDMKAAMRLLNTKQGEKVLQAILTAHRGLLMDIDQLKN